MKQKRQMLTYKIISIPTFCGFIRKRLAPAVIPNDGKQTPMRGHPVFIAQHATGCCCRGCFEKWHRIPAGRELTDEEQH